VTLETGVRPGERVKKGVFLYSGCKSYTTRAVTRSGAYLTADWKTSFQEVDLKKRYTKRRLGRVARLRMECSVRFSPFINPGY
jgi:hypothetical protein